MTPQYRVYKIKTTSEFCAFLLKIKMVKKINLRIKYKNVYHIKKQENFYLVNISLSVKI